MAIKHLSSIDLTGLEVYGLRPEHVPFSQFGTLSTYTGRIVYDSTNNRVKFYDGTTWLDMSGDIREITVGVGLTGGGTADTVNVSIDSAIAGNGLTWDAVNGIINIGAGDGIEVTGSNVRFKNATSLTEGALMYWNDLDAQLENSRISQSAQVTQNGTEYTVTVNADYTILTGNLTVQGTVTSISSNEVNIGDSIIKLNFDETGAPSQNAGFEVERGTENNVSFIWNESNDYFSTVDQPLHVGYVESLANISNQDFFYVYDNTVGETGIIKKANIAAVSEIMGAPKWWTLDQGQGSVSKVGNTYTITHTFNTKAIIVQILDAATYETVMVDVARPTATTVTVSFATPVLEAAYIAILSAAKLNGDNLAYEGPTSANP